MAETNYKAQDMCMDWNDSIEKDGMDFTPLPTGIYEFEVTGFERARHPGSTNLPPCNKAALTLTAFGENGRTSRIFCDLFLYRTMEWKLSDFFRSIGQKKHGERFSPDWTRIIGERGHALVKVTSYTDRNGNERTKNEVDKFLDAEAFQKSDPPAATPVQTRLDLEGTGFTDTFQSAEEDIPF